jgi:hypothetical protein
MDWLKNERSVRRRQGVFVVSAMGMMASILLTGPQAASAQVAPEGRLTLNARLSRWQGIPAKGRKGPKGFDLQFALVGSRFDGAFGMDGLPLSVPEGEAFDTQIKLINAGTKDIKVAAVTVVGDGLTLNTALLIRKIGPKSSAAVAGFKVPPQSSAGSTFVITVLLSNGDKHTATLRFSRPT